MVLMRFKITTALLLIALCMLVCCTAYAQQNVLWQIGEFDHNYKELALVGNYAAYSSTFPKDVTFRVGTDDAKTSWPFVQPGPADGWAESRVHPFSVVFNLPGKPVGVFKLKVDLVNTHPALPPTYEVAVNGKSGRTKLPAGLAGEPWQDASEGKAFSLDMAFPASLFREGQNKIVLACVEGSWIVYDGLSLSNDPAATAPEHAISRLDVGPTTRFVRSGRRLKQVVELSAQCWPGPEALTAVVKVGKNVTRRALTHDALGSVTGELYVDEVTKPTRVDVELRAGTQTKSASCELRPQKHWKIYVQPSVHVDIGYTDYQERVAALHNDNMSLALDLCSKYPEFKWNTEAAWVEDNYLSKMPADKKGEFVRLAKEGRIGCQAIYGNMLTGLCSDEELIRDLYFAHSTADKNGIPFDIAMSSDVPSQVWTLPTVLAGSGIRYFSDGLNPTRADSVGRFFGKSPFYWQGPDGSRVLTWMFPGYAYATALGLTENTRRAIVGIEGYLGWFDRGDYPYDAVLAFGGYSDNGRLTPALPETVRQWNKRYAYPRIILCRGPEFFHYIESSFQDKIPTISGDGGVYWEDGAGSSAAHTAMTRRAKESLVTAEKLHALASLSGCNEYPTSDFDDAWKNAILYDEHTWGAAGSISDPTGDQTVHQWKVKSSFAYAAARQSERLMEQGLTNLAKSVTANEPSVVVFNMLSWATSGLVKCETPDGKPIEFWAKDVPPIGYRTFPLSTLAQASTSQKPERPVETGSPVMENSFYRVTLDRGTGAISSLYDKELSRELVDSNANCALNQYVYVAGKPEPGRKISGIDEAVQGSGTQSTHFRMSESPGASIMRIEGSSESAPRWTTTVTLYKNEKRIDLDNTLQKDETCSKEAGYFAFPFALTQPEFYVSVPDGVMRPKRDMLDGACMQWFCTQDFVAGADKSCAVVWTAVDSPLFTLGDINRETFKSPLSIDNGHIFAYVFNNYWFTNYKASQGGDMRFRFSITSMPAYDPVVAARFGQSVRNPLLAYACKVVQEPSVTRAAESFALVEPPNVFVQAGKAAHSGHGLIIRLREIAGKKSQALVTLPTGKFREAWACNLVEAPQSTLRIVGGRLAVPIAGNGLATVLLK